MATQNTFDAIVIGSGIGGLTCGAFLARSDKKVLVLEQHSKLGGYAHNFKRRGYVFESGIHSVPMGPQGLIQHLLELLGVAQNITIEPLNSMYRFILPDLNYAIPMQHEEIIASLEQRFPHQRDGLKNLFDDLRHFYAVLAKPAFSFETNFVEEDTAFVSAYHNRTLANYISSFITDPLLQQVFYSMWPYAGVTPASAPAVFFAMMWSLHFLEGSHFVKGGFSSLAKALGSVIQHHGGELHMREAAERVLVEDGKFCGVITSTGDEYRAALCVSNISPYTLHGQLIADAPKRKLWMRRLSRLKPSVSCVAAYIGIKGNLDSLIDDNITFWYEHSDHEKMFANSMHTTQAPLDHLVVLKTSQQETPDTLTLMRFMHADASGNWAEDKKQLGEAMLAKACELYPGLSAMIDYVEYASPATFERYTRNTAGALYGFENTADMYGEAKLPIKTYLPNLFQVGHWGKPGGGVWNVMLNGYTASKLILRELD